MKHIPGLYVQESTDFRLLRVRWSGGRNMQHFREALNRFLDLAQQHSTLRILLDLNDQPDVPVYDQLWLSTTLLPRAVKLPVRQLVIILSDKRIYNRHVVESLLTQFQSQIRCDIQFFTQPEAALLWLTDYSPRVPELLAEWDQSDSPGGHPEGLTGPSVRYRHP